MKQIGIILLSVGIASLIITGYYNIEPLMVISAALLIVGGVLMKLSE